MKYLKLHTLLTNTQKVFLEGRVGEVNSSVREWAEGQKRNVEQNSDEERVREAKQLAMSQIPTLAGRTMDDIAKHFWRLGSIEKKGAIEGLEKSVRERVLNTLKIAVAPGMTMPAWGGNYLKVIQDIEKDEDKAVMTLQDTDRALQSITQLKSKYERQAQVLIDRKKELDKTRKNVANLFRLGNNVLVPAWIISRSEYTRKENTSEHYRFSKGNEVALRVFNELEQKIKNKKERASESFNDNKKHVEESFSGLSPDNKEAFMVYVKAESMGHNQLDMAPDWAKQVVFGLDFQQRIEVFKALNLDPQTSLQALTKNKDLFDSVEGELDQRRTVLNRQVRNINTDNLAALKKSLKGFKADSSFDPSNSGSVQTFVSEIESYLDQIGDLDIATCFAGYPRGENLNHTEKLVAYLGVLISRKDDLVEAKMAKPLKAKLRTYINFLENIDTQDESEIEGQTEEFLDQRDVIVNRLKAGKRLANTTLSKVDHPQKIDESEYLKIDTFIGQTKREKSLYDELKEKNKLSESEIKKLDVLYAKIDKIISLFEDLRNAWEQEEENFKKLDKERQVAIKSSESEVLKLREQISDLEDDRERIIKSFENKKDRINNRTDAEKARLIAKEKSKLGILEQNVLDLQASLDTAKGKRDDLESSIDEDSAVLPEGASQQQQITEYQKRQSRENKIIRKIDSQERIIEGLNSDLRKLNSEVAASKGKVEEYESDLANTHDIEEKEQETLEKHENKIRELKIKLREANKDFTDKTFDRSDYDITKTKKHFAEVLSTLTQDLNDLEKFKKADEIGSSTEQINRYLLELSAEANNQQHQARLEALQAETLTTLQKLPKGVQLGQINFVQYLHGRKMTSDTALGDPKSHLNNFTILDHTNDAVILYQRGGSQLVVVQKSAISNKVEVLVLAAPSDFDPTQNIPLSYIPEKADQIGELTTINI